MDDSSLLTSEVIASPPVEVAADVVVPMDVVREARVEAPATPARIATLPKAYARATFAPPTAGAIAPETVTMARLCVLASGSSGNCSVLEIRDEGGRVTRVLVDLGLSPRQTCGVLNSVGVSLDQIDAAVITHMDTDHCHTGWAEGLPRHVEVFVHRTHAGAAYRRGLNNGRVHTFDGAFATTRGVVVRPLMNFHDASGCAAFRFELGPIGSLGYATDLGRVTDELLEHMRGVDVLAIESNYCPERQMSSDRPAFLKRRIMGGRGHLSNHEALRAIEAIAPSRHVVLLHLSRQCNCPDLVASMHEGADYCLTISRREQPTRWVQWAGSRHLKLPEQGTLGVW